MHQVTMPRLSDSMAEGTIVRWLKGNGDKVRSGEEIVEIETDKATVAYEADVGGLLSIVAGEGQTVAVGTPIATIGEQLSTPTSTTAGLDVAAPSNQDADGQPTALATSAASPGRRSRGINAAPVARRAAQRLGVDLASVVGTGPYGRITKADVVAAAAPGPVDTPIMPSLPGTAEPTIGAAEATITELTRTQSIIARRMAESRATVPDFALEVDVDMTAAVALRAELMQVADPAPSLNDLVVKAAAIALRRHPRANGSYRDGRFELHGDVNVGLAVAAQDALLVPVVHHADVKSLGAIAAETRGLAERVRSGTITPSELSGGTFTVSNLGMYGIDRFEGIINAPQAAILCVGAVTDRPIARDGAVVVAAQMTLTLACDHRILYGVDAAELLAEIRSLLERPLGLLL